MSSTSPRSLRILVVEDRSDSSYAMIRLLRHDGHDVHVATGFADALSAAAGLTTIDVLVSNIALPDGDGRDLLRLLRERRHGGVSTAIALTGHSDREWVAECRGAGFAAVLVKPVALAELLEVVRATRPIVSHGEQNP